MVAGVALAVADYLGFDVTAVRIGFVVLALLGGLAVPLYLAAWLIIPEEGRETAPLDGWLHRADLRGQH
jgi:phage shock protein PspC (stress-responsive transcriptional regulator)